MYGQIGNNIGISSGIAGMPPQDPFGNSSVGSAINQIQSRTEDLNAAIRTLLARLSPVLVQAPNASMTNEGQTTSEVSSELGYALRGIHNQIQAEVAAIHHILDRLSI